MVNFLTSDRLNKTKIRNSEIRKQTKVKDAIIKILETLRFFVFERTKHQPRRNLRSYLVLQRLCNEAALSPGIDAFCY